MNGPSKKSNKKVIVIGAGLGGLAAASYAAKAGFNVTLIEKNNFLGGRAQVQNRKGYLVDMGPSWYWMREVIDGFFNDFGYKTDDLFRLVRLKPAYRVFFRDAYMDIPENVYELANLFEQEEKGSGKKLHQLLNKTSKVYSIAMRRFVSAPFTTYLDIFRASFIKDGLAILSHYNGFRSVDSFYRSYFKSEKLIKLLSFPIFFLGDSTKKIPAVYAMMNHVDYNLGTWYPMGGFGKVVDGFEKVAKETGVAVLKNTKVTSINVINGKVVSVKTAKGSIDADIVISNAEMPHSETELLNVKYQSYSTSYWAKKRLAPSAYLLYLGVNTKVPDLLHHSLFFHHDWIDHNHALFHRPVWPDKPLYYVSCPTKTDPTIAPENHDLLTILVPIPAGLKDTPESRQKLQNFLLSDLSKKINFPLLKHIAWQQSYSVDGFLSDYHAYKGNAYGLGQGTFQTAIFRPGFKSKKVKNLFYAGHFTIPGIGVPMVVLSGKLVAKYKEKTYE